MDKSNAQTGPKVSQIANIFQRKNTEEEESKEASKETSGNGVVRTESHAARFNNARALFERLGESRVNRPSSFSIKHSTSKDDNLKDPSPERQRSPSPPKKQQKGYTNGINGNKNEIGMIQNVSRIKAEKPEKPEKPERKFNSKELIEKQKNWTSHFSKSKPSPTTGINRCDIIRTVPGTGVISNADIVAPKKEQSRSSSFETPSSPPQKYSPIPPEVKPRTTSRSSSLSSPTKAPLPSIPTPGNNTKSSPQRQPDGNESQPDSIPISRRYSSDRESNSLNSPAHALSSNASSSGPSSPVHTEDEKQENESNEKTDFAATEGSYKFYLWFL
jgi:neurabin